MATFTGWYSIEQNGKIWIDADSLEEAEALVEKVISGEIEMESLPGFKTKTKMYDFGVDELEEEEN
jgi:exosome complex RNA-binding protein Rrp4